MYSVQYLFVHWTVKHLVTKGNSTTKLGIKGGEVLSLNASHWKPLGNLGTEVKANSEQFKVVRRNILWFFFGNRIIIRNIFSSIKKFQENCIYIEKFSKKSGLVTIQLLCLFGLIPGLAELAGERRGQQRGQEQQPQV